MAASDTTISVRLPLETRNALDRAAKSTRRSRAFLIKEALDKHLGALESDARAGQRHRRLALLKDLTSAGDRAGRKRSGAEIDAMIRFIRGDE
jgi:predicted DNA-binding protein